MPKRNLSENEHNERLMNKKPRFNVDLDKSDTSQPPDNDQDELIDIPDLSEVSRGELESMIYRVVKRNNISTAKAKYLIRRMLNHPYVIDRFRTLFDSDKPQFDLLYERRITRSSKRKIENGEDTNSNYLDPDLIGRLLLSPPTINSFEFDNDDNNDKDYLPPDSENSVDSDQSSLVSDIVNKEIMLSPYCTRSKASLNDLQIDVLDDSLVDLDTEEIMNNEPVYHPPFTTEEMNNLMEMDADEERYQEFKNSLNCDDFKNDEAEDDPEFDVLAQIDDLDEDIIDDYRNDRTVNIPKAEVFGLLKDNNLVEGNGSSSSNKKMITMLYEDDETVYDEQCPNVKDILQELTFTPEQRDRLSRQIIMFYQQLATIFVMLFDQQHLKKITESQKSFYYQMSRNIPENSNDSVFDPLNRCDVGKVLSYYKGISYLPTSQFNSSTLCRKIDFPKCIMATLIYSPAFPYVQLLPSSFKVYNTNPIDFFKQIPFLPSEDKLLTMGIIQFSHQCHKMLKLIKKYLFPIRSTDQLRNRKTNIVRKQKESNRRESELLAELLQYSGCFQTNKKNPIKVYSDFAKLPVHVTSIWQRKHEWKSLLNTYKSLLIKTVPNLMYDLHLCTKDEWSRSNRLSSNRRNVLTKEIQYCNWYSSPWEHEKIDDAKNDKKENCVKTVLRKVINKKSFPQYEVPKNCELRKFLERWNNNCDNKDISKPPTNKHSHNRNLIFLRKSIKRAKVFFFKYNSKKEQKKILTEQSYAHYFRNDDTVNLFPNTLFKSRLEELIITKDLKNPRLQRFQNKCRDKERDIIDFTSLSFCNRDEDDLVFCRNLLNNLRNNLDADEYEKCLDKLNEFQVIENDSNFDESVLELMKYLMDVVKSKPGNLNTYEDLLSLLTLQQAMKLGCEIEWCTVRNINQLYSLMKSINMTHKRRFWVRLSTLIRKSNEGLCSLSKVIQHLYSGTKANGYLQSLIAPLLNCWEAPFPNFPQAFSNIDTLSSNASIAEFSKNSEKDEWEYCTELAEQPKGPCPCSCHDNVWNNNTTNKESTIIRHCSNCNLKANNGWIYIDDSKNHRRLITVNLPSDSKPGLCKKDNSSEENNKSTNPKTDSTASMSVIEFLKTKNPQVKQLHNRCITIKNLQNNDSSLTKTDEKQNQPPWVLLPPSNFKPYMRIIDDGEAAMDVDVFRQIKCQKMSQEYDCDMNLQIPKFESTVKTEAFSQPQIWTEDDNIRLMTLCQKHGVTTDTFSYLQEEYFSDRTVEQIEDQFNYLFQKVLERQQISSDFDNCS